MRRRSRNQAPFSLFAFQDIITAVTGVLILIVLILALTLATSPMNESVVQPDQLQAIGQQAELLEREVQKLDQQVKSNQQLVALVSQYGSGDLQQLIDALKASAEQASRLKHAQQQSTTTTNDAVKTQQEVAAHLHRQIQSSLAEIEDVRDEIRELDDSNRILYEFKSTANKPWLVDLANNEWLLARADQAMTPVTISGRNVDERLDELVAWVQQDPTNRNYLVLLVRPDTIRTFDRIRKEAALATVDFGFDVISKNATVIDPVNGAVLK